MIHLPFLGKQHLYLRFLEPYINTVKEQLSFS